MKPLAIALASLAGLATAATAQAEPPKIGVYYFPGWSNDPFNVADSWQRIRPFPERQPLLGWYAGSSRGTLQKQADMMQVAHLDYVVFDWYYENGKVQLDGPLKAYIALSTPRPKLSLMWANHGGHTTTQVWHAIVDIWAGYFAKARFFQIGGSNVIFVFNAQRFADDAKASGASAAGWTDYAQAEMRRRHLPPIYFVAGVFSGNDTIIPVATANGFSSISAYNIHSRPDSHINGKGYANLDALYREQWQRMARFTGFKPILPITSGWDHRPWGPMPNRDGSIPTPAEFKTHLQAAREFMIDRRIDAGVICCWNEYGEGSFIEPTKKAGTALLNNVSATFGHGLRDR